MRSSVTRRIKTHEDLEVYQVAFKAAMVIFELSKKFPKEEKYSLTDQIRRSSRSVCANLAEGWRKRRYKAAFIAKLSDSEAVLTLKGHLRITMQLRIKQQKFKFGLNFLLNVAV